MENHFNLCGLKSTSIYLLIILYFGLGLSCEDILLRTSESKVIDLLEKDIHLLEVEKGTAQATIQMVMGQSDQKRNKLSSSQRTVPEDTTFTLSHNQFPTSPSVPTLTQYRCMLTISMKIYSQNVRA
jgi:hypothetical protein